ncbi:hypothetical protein OSB04_019592 [Centaurea solstitialis]|uniref:Uncharacterized protein n=1 Tax=Centaurea solstitialis TaxID=347529 RepID=A0AA38SQM2_9ASTR|nr:hypothetical protein OSB04_019592 [Centaurea solstitialis]
MRRLLHQFSKCDTDRIRAVSRVLKIYWKQRKRARKKIENQHLKHGRSRLKQPRNARKMARAASVSPTLNQADIEEIIAAFSVTLNTTLTNANNNLIAAKNANTTALTNNLSNFLYGRPIRDRHPNRRPPPHRRPTPSVHSSSESEPKEEERPPLNDPE